MFEIAKYLKVLYVEDDEMIRYSTQKALENFFEHIDTAEDGKEGLERYKEQYGEDESFYDIVITDINMPIMNGLQMSEEILRVDPKQSIVITTAFNDAEYLNKAIEIGVDGYLTKPISLKPLKQTIMKISQNIYDRKFVQRHIKFVEDSNAELEKKVEKRTKQLREQIETANRLNAVKSEFLANMSHEIRTPLNAMLGFIELIADESKEEHTLRYASIVKSSGEDLLKIIGDILDFSKIESAKIEIHKSSFNVRDELRMSIELFKAKCLEKEIQLHVEFTENLPEFIETDLLRLKQIISNLIGNAIKFTKPQKNIGVFFAYRENLLDVRVKDEGKGISADKIKAIFDPFLQEDSSTTKEYGGTGLGLSISKELTQLLGGTLEVKSVEGMGSEFYFSIPIKVVEEPQKTEINDLKVDFTDKKILLVEDNTANQIYMEVLFKKVGIAYDIVHNGKEAVDIFSKMLHNIYDLILMDENMPQMNGIAATKKILEIKESRNLRRIPIIALTANAIKGDREKFLEAGMDEYLTKPINKETLCEVLHGFLEQRAL